MPACPFYVFTGYKCPSCGFTRSLHALLHGQIGEAFLFNPYQVVSIPLAIFIIALALSAPTPKRDRLLRIAVIAYAVTFIAWWILRNVMGI